MDKNKYKDIIESKCTYLAGAHRRFSKTYLERNQKEKLFSLNSEVDVHALLNRDEIKKTIKTQEDKVDVFQLRKTKAYAEKFEEIRDGIRFNISEAKDIEAFTKSRKQGLCFRVYNVGQGLATSIEEIGEPPFLYFDFGMSFGVNTFNKPIHMNINVDYHPSIVISHIHTDHWYALMEFPGAFRCNWYIPNQDLGILFSKRCAEIIVSGGCVNRIISTITGNMGTIFVSGNSKCNPEHAPQHKHDTGLSMRLRFTMRDNIINVLVPGDQRYDFIPDVFLSDIHVLVASHHGGEYSWSNRRGVYLDIPLAVEHLQSIIVYSYGTDNTHDHPSKIDDYVSRGWRRAHYTPEDSDYVLS